MFPVFRHFKIANDRNGQAVVISCFQREASILVSQMGVCIELELNPFFGLRLVQNSRMGETLGSVPSTTK